MPSVSLNQAFNAGNRRTARIMAWEISRSIPSQNGVDSVDPTEIDTHSQGKGGNCVSEVEAPFFFSASQTPR